MSKIFVYLDNRKSVVFFEYESTLVPMLKDVITFDEKNYVVNKRTIKVDSVNDIHLLVREEGNFTI